MLHCAPATTPVTSGPRVSVHHGVVLSDEDATLYRSLVGGLQYLTLTRPDLCFAVNYVWQFMHRPTSLHFQLVKRILRYVKGTVSSGVTLSEGPCNVLKSYSDSDWAGCPDTRKSTSGYCIFCGNSLVSWSSKKQPTISRSSAEAEYKTLAVTSAKMLWIS